VTGSRALFGDGETIARTIKQTVHDEVGLTVSVGVAATKLVAKIGSDLRKPDGLVVVPPGDEAAFLAPLPISRLWGVGEKTAAVLREFGVQTIGDLAALPPDALERRFGKHGAALVERARGVDADPVATGDPAKSIGHEHTFGHDTADREVIERTLLGLADGVAWRLRAAGLKAATITLKLRDSSFTTITRQTTLDVPGDLTEPIYDAALVLLRRELSGQRIRLVGVTASNFRDREQLALFESAGDPKRHQAAEAMDSIRRKYGERAVTRGRLVRAGVPTVFERDPNSAVEGRLGVPDAPTGRRRRAAEGPAAGEAVEPASDDGIDPPAGDEF
jgi:DNA polymerase-4